jgi:hypothetical protein
MRKEGYYWVKYGTEWYIGHYYRHDDYNMFWCLESITSHYNYFMDTDFEGIKEERIKAPY